MGLFDLIFKKKDSYINADGYFKTFSAYTPVFTSWNGQLYESELVRAAVDARARHISKLKVEVIGSARPKLQTMIRKAPNSFQTWSQFLYRLSTILDMQNNAFIVPVFRDNELAGYYSVLPSLCELVAVNDIPYLRYTFASGEKAAVELSACGIMTKFQYRDDLFGESNNALSNTMDLLNIQAQGIKEGIKNGAAYRFMGQVTNFTKNEDLAKERQRFTEENLKKDSGGGLLLFPNTYQNLQQIKPQTYTVDAEQEKLIQTNVYNYYGVNEKILQNMAYGDELNAFFEGSIEPFSIQFSEVLTLMSFTGTEIGHGSYIQATANRLQYMSNSDKLNVSSQMADRGIMTRNEIREMWNLPRIEGGDVATIRGEYYLMDDDGNISKEGGDMATQEAENE